MDNTFVPSPRAVSSSATHDRLVLHAEQANPFKLKMRAHKEEEAKNETKQYSDWDFSAVRGNFQSSSLANLTKFSDSLVQAIPVKFNSRIWSLALVDICIWLWALWLRLRLRLRRLVSASYSILAHAQRCVTRRWTSTEVGDSKVCACGVNCSAIGRRRKRRRHVHVCVYRFYTDFCCRFF